MPHQAVYKITIDGTEVTSNFAPLLLALEIHKHDGGKADTCQIELDDSYGQLALPRTGAYIEIELYWSDDEEGATATFMGYTDEPSSRSREQEGDDLGTPRAHKIRKHADADNGLGYRGGRSQGRVLSISGKSVDMGGKAKQQQEDHSDDCSFSDVAQKWAGEAGLTAKVDDTLGQIQRKYWGIHNESFMTWGTRVARELGATFKIFGQTATFTPRSGGTSASGQELTPIDVSWDDGSGSGNLIEWDITPTIERSQFGMMGVRWYSVEDAQHMIEQGSTDETGSGEDNSGVTNTHKFKKPDKDQAANQVSANSSESKRDAGSADSVLIDGNPAAEPEAPCNVSGIRDGVDGSYLIKSVSHKLDRGGGFLTHLALKQPTGTAGTDSRSTSADGDSSDAGASSGPSTGPGGLLGHV